MTWIPNLIRWAHPPESRKKTMRILDASKDLTRWLLKSLKLMQRAKVEHCWPAMNLWIISDWLDLDLSCTLTSNGLLSKIILANQTGFKLVLLQIQTQHMENFILSWMYPHHHLGKVLKLDHRTIELSATHDPISFTITVMILTMWTLLQPM